ncbi:tetratricopeptide repeat protein [Sorangium sp. So ce385]|uniref:tetratricopeptide repeat protein n=1 Tax=Sorangium sp. So ce385 TaxID=3133308 RepID=UPI003F5BC8BF
MVLPPSAPDHAPAPADRALHERRRLILRLGEAGVLVLVDGARPERLGSLVRALAADEPELLVHADATQLARAPKGAAVVLVPDAAQAGWLNLERPILAERALRVILFSDAATSAALARKAPDFFHWISHRLECPPGPWPPAVWAIRAADERGWGIFWEEGDLDEAFAAALPASTRVRVSAAAPYAALVEAIRAAGNAWLEASEVDSSFELRRLRWALVEVGRRAPLVTERVVARGRAVAPGAGPMGLLEVDSRRMPLAQAIQELEAAGAEGAGRLAAFLDLERGAVATAVKLLAAGLPQARLDDVARAAGDPMQRLWPLCSANGVSPVLSAGTSLLRTNIAPRRDAAFLCEKLVSERRWLDAARGAIVSGDPIVAIHWAQRALAEDGGSVDAARALGVALAEGGHLGRAREILRDAVAQHRPAAEGELEGHAALVDDLAGVIQAMDLSGARPQLEEALTLLDDRDVEPSPGDANALRWQAQRLVAAGNLTGARTKLEEVSALLTRMLGTEEDPRVAASVRDLARVLFAQGKATRARELLEQALRIETKAHGDWHPRVANSLRDLSRILFAQSDLRGARELLERALDIQLRVYGTEEHPGIADSLHLLARVLFAQGDLSNAHQLLERELRIRTNVEGANTPKDISASLASLSMVLLSQGNLAGAREALERAVPLLERVHGTAEHPEVAVMEGNLGSVLLAMGETERGIALRRRAYETLRAQLGPDHPLTRDMERRLPRAVSLADAAAPHAVEPIEGMPEARNAPSS